jgi:hypothetical protein
MKNKTFNIKSTVNSKLKSQTVTCEGDLGIKNAAAIKESIQSMNFKSESVTFRLKNVEKFDITSIQTVRAIGYSLLNKGKSVQISAEFPKDIERLMKNTGFDNIL